MTNETFGAEYLETVEAPKFGGTLNRNMGQCDISWSYAQCRNWVNGGFIAPSDLSFSPDLGHMWS